MQEKKISFQPYISAEIVQIPQKLRHESTKFLLKKYISDISSVNVTTKYGNFIPISQIQRLFHTRNSKDS